jgi:hypothetical protein
MVSLVFVVNAGTSNQSVMNAVMGSVSQLVDVVVLAIVGVGVNVNGRNFKQHTKCSKKGDINYA